MDHHVSESERARDLKGKTARATIWTAGSRVTQQALQFAIMVFLARLLTPRDFGLIGMIVVFTGFATLFVDSGFGSALIQRKKLTPNHLSTALWLNLGVGFGLSVLSVGAAPLVSLFYGQHRLTLLTMISGLNFTLTALTVVQLSLLERAMHFRRIAFIENAAAAVAGVLAVASALMGAGVWSLVIFTLSSTATRGALLWLASDWRPSGGIDRKSLGELWGFGKHLVGANALIYWSRNSDNLLVGRFVGAAGLGIYSRAYTLMLLPLAQISSVVGRTLFPAISRIDGDMGRIRQAYLRAVGIIALLSFPLCISLFVSADPLVKALLGSRWHQVTPIFQILCVPALLESVSSTAGIIYQSQARTDWMFRWQLVSAPVTVVFFVVGIHWGIKGIAIAYAIRSIPITYFSLSIAGRLIGVRFRDIAAAVRTALFSSLIAGGVAWLAGLVAVGLASPLRLLVELATGAGVYFILIYGARPRSYLDLCETLTVRSPP